jgi:adenylate cyclase
VRVYIRTDHVEVDKLPTASNPVFFAGRDVQSFRVQRGEHFVLGSTRFFIGDVQHVLPTPSAHAVIEEVTFDRQELRNVRFRDADKRIEVLANLPDVIWGARTDSELHHRLVNLILAGVPHAEAVAIVKLAEHGSAAVLHWDRRHEAAGEFRPSGRLVEDAVHLRRRSVLHVWESQDQFSEDYTAMAEFDWAFCTPVLNPAVEPWGLYVAGRLDRPFVEGPPVSADGVYLQADVKFTELVAEIISTVQRLNKLERQRANLQQFFPPAIRSALFDDFHTDLLEPRECEVTVLFCDLRGFSKKAEESADNLLGLFDRVSSALEVMNLHISKQGGVTADFQGDAVLGFWGWPFESEKAPLSACRAALGIRRAFDEIHRQKDHPLVDFKMGIGIAHGIAVAGKIGTTEQVKVTVFGSVVNLASRLEGMTKMLRVPIVLDEATVEKVLTRLDPSEGRLRRLAKVLPYGMERPVVVSELLPPESEDTELTDAHLEQFQQGVDHFVAGRWEEAYRCLHEMPPSDRAQDFLSMRIAQHNRVAPADWDGVIRFSNK